MSRPERTRRCEIKLARALPTHGPATGRRMARREGPVGWGRHEARRQTLMLITAELVANAVRHGRAPRRDFHVRLSEITDSLRVEVADTRSERVPLLSDRVPQGDAESGRPPDRAGADDPLGGRPARGRAGEDRAGGTAPDAMHTRPGHRRPVSRQRPGWQTLVGVRYQCRALVSFAWQGAGESRGSTRPPCPTTTTTPNT
jgi:hypothetical protein